MTSALYLEHYLDGLEHLPNELKRNFTLMRDLDSRAQVLMKSIDEKANEFMKSLVNSKENFSDEVKKEKLQAIQDLFNKAKEYGDDKVQLAIQTYELVDKHIRRLDSDLARFEGEIQDKTLNAREKSEENVTKKGRKKVKDGKSVAKKKRAHSSEDEARPAGNGGAATTGTNSGATNSNGKGKNTKKQKKSVENDDTAQDGGHATPHPSDVLDMPVDPNEPTYCLCHQVSYGEMIGCDNPDCPIEWFHFACVGLTIKPKGKWYCPKCSQDLETVDLQEIMSEEYARELQTKENSLPVVAPQMPQPLKPIAKPLPSTSAPAPTVDSFEEPVAGCSRAIDPGKHPAAIPADVLRAIEEADQQELDSDAVIARMLQAQFDAEYDEQIKREENHRNKDSKVKVSYKNYRVIPEELLYEEPEDVPVDPKSDWDRFEANEKEQRLLPRTGFRVNEEGEMLTKHNLDISGRSNACKVMSFPPEVSTGDAAGFDMKLSNKVFNQLKSHSKKATKKQHKAQDRKENIATAEMGLDEPTRLILYKWINSQLLESIDGVISTGKEAVILHAETDPTNPNIEEGEPAPPREVAIKVFSTTLNEFKQRDRYIKDDFRFAGRFSKQNSRTVINMWAEKELRNLNRIKRVGIPCPDVVALKKNVLVMSFVGENLVPAPKLKEALLSEAQLIVAYEEIVQIMHTLYKEARLVHADLSEYNILWHDERCWIIDVAQSVEPGHPGALEFLMRDCDNISTFFTKRGVHGVKSKEDLFFDITGLDPLSHNATILERIHMKGEPAHVVSAVDDDTPEYFKPMEYPFEFAWNKVESSKAKRRHQAGSGHPGSSTQQRPCRTKSDSSGSCASDVEVTLKEEVVAVA
uniref:Inhibitor of growth protein n=1 Tax=Anopheles atroparvus TaxID=41427 RepID=A0A182IVQ1_ANOAO